MKNLVWVGALALAATLVLGSAPGALAAGWGGGAQVAEPAPVSPSPLASLGLSDQQLAQIRELRQNNYKETRKLRIQMMDARFALSQLKLERNPDQKAVEAKTRELQDLHSRLQNSRVQARQKLQAILTPEQWNKLQETVRSGRRGGPGHVGRGGAGGLEL